MPTLPSGTVIFLFTDLEGSTRLWEQFPIAMRPALARHDALLRRAVEDNAGRVIKTTGDGIHAVFQSTALSLSAALQAQQALAAEPWTGLAPHALRVRMGLHAGEAELREGDYYGSVLNRAARLMSAAHGGQILVSQAVAELARDQLPAGARLLDLGDHRLKDLARPERVFQLAHPSLPADFPPLMSLDAAPNNLPIQLTSFIGREKEIGEIRGLLASARLVTLTGSGGTGKTRLAQETSVLELAAFPDGVWWIELAPLADPAQILPALASIFGLHEAPSVPLTEMVAEYLARKQALLILDNCEHLIAECARLADLLLHRCKGLKILASSREALGIAGEVAYRIPSLSDTEAFQLFEERARAANPAFTTAPAGAAALEQICRRLDGIPLAIELAAARIRLLSPEQIAARLDDRFRLLVGGSRTALPRQQTLRALIDWSYALLPEAEKRLLRTASVFAGGFTLEAVESVADDPAALENLEQLVNKSLVVTEDCAAAMRYSLLETIRQYAREKLFDLGLEETAQARTRHLAYFVRLARASLPRLTGPEMAGCLDELDLEQDNLRAAIDWALETDPLSALRIAELLPYFWGRRLSAKEGYAWVSEALARAGRLPQARDPNPELRLAMGWGLLGKATMAFQLGDNDDAWSAISASVGLARGVEDPFLLSSALAIGSTVCGFRGDLSAARAWAQESSDLSRRHGFLYTLANVTGLEMFISVAVGQPIPPGLIEETLQAARASGNPWVLGLTLANIGRVRTREGRWAEALSLLEESASLFREIRDQSMYNMSRSEIGHLWRAQGRYAEASAVYCETIDAYKNHAQFAAAAHELECFAFIAAELGQDERAAALLGAAEALREKNKTAMTVIERSEYQGILARLRGRMEETAFRQSWAAGRILTTEQALELALG